MKRTPLPSLAVALAALGVLGIFTLGVRAARAETGKSEAKAKKAAACPDTSLGETVADCPWGSIARTLIEEAPKAKKGALAARFKKLAPELDRALVADAKRLSWKTLWGRSINFDELAKGVIVDPAIVLVLEDKFGITAHQKPMVVDNAIDSITAGKEAGFDETSKAPLIGTPAATDTAGHQLVHAGLEHTYGYLFSVLKTAYGYKRARWVEGEIEKGFHLDDGLLGPKPKAGTLFANVTYFIGRIAFRSDAEALKTLKQGGAAPAIEKFNYDKLKPIRLEETVEGKDETRATRKVTLRTDLVPMPHAKDAKKNTHLLIYSIHDPSNGGAALISAFPVAQSFVDTVTKAEDLGEGKPVKSRYNAYVEGISGQDLKGSRKVIP